MRILYIIDKMHNFAGMERILACKMNYIVENTDHVVALSSYEQNNKPIPFPLDAKIQYLPMDVIMPNRSEMTFVQWLMKYVQARQIFRTQYKQLLEKANPDIVVCTGYSFQVMDIIVTEAYNHHAKPLVESHTKGDTLTFVYKYSYNPKLQFLCKLWDKHIMRSLSNVSCVVTLTKRDVSFWSNYVTRVEIIPNMLTVNPVMVKDYAVKHVISAGRYMIEKGFDRLIETWHVLKENRKEGQLDNWQLSVYGNGDRMPYQVLVSKYGLEDSVHLYTATENIAEKFSECSLYVMSSRYEGFGLVLTEAMSCGLPCVSFDCSYGPRDIISNGEDGFLVEDGNVDALAEAMEKLMNDVNLRKQMGEKAVKNISRYNRDTIMSRWLNLFNTI